MHHYFLPDNFAGGFPNWRLRILHHVARALGLLVKVEGFPYGTKRNLVPGGSYTTGHVSGAALRETGTPSYTHSISGTAFSGAWQSAQATSADAAYDKYKRHIDAVYNGGAPLAGTQPLAPGHDA